MKSHTGRRESLSCRRHTHGNFPQRLGGHASTRSAISHHRPHTKDCHRFCGEETVCPNARQTSTGIRPIEQTPSGGSIANDRQPRTTAATSLAAAESVTTTHRNAESAPDRMYRHSSCSRPPAAAAAAAVARESIPLIPDCSQLGRLQSLSSLAAAAPARGAERRLISPGGDKAQRPRDEAQRRRDEVRRRRSGVGAS